MERKLTLLDKLMRLPFLKKLVRQFVIRVTSLGAIRKALRSASQAGKLPRGVWQWLPVSLLFQLRLPAGQEFSYSVVPGDGIGKALYWQGVEFLGGEFQAFYRMIGRSHFFVDVGANTGIFSLIACATNSDIRVIAFEPVPEIYEKLVTNVTINAFQDRCQMVQKSRLRCCGHYATPSSSRRDSHRSHFRVAEQVGPAKWDSHRYCFNDLR